MKKRAKILIKNLYPFLFTTYPFLILYSDNTSEVPIKVLITTTAPLILFALFVFFLFFKITRSKNKSAFLTFVVIAYIYSFNASFLSLNYPVFWFYSLIWLVIIVLLTILLKKNTFDVYLFNRFLSVVFYSLTIASLVSISYTTLRNLSLKRTIISQLKSDIDNINNYSNRSKDRVDRDIYYLVFDRYGSNESLKLAFDYDNSEFEEFLKKSGFHVSSSAKSNYPRTRHSLASSLNMQYLDLLVQEMGDESSNWHSIYLMVNNSSVVSSLKDYGYRYIHFGSSWEPTSKSAHADKNYNYYPVSNFMIKSYAHLIPFPITARIEAFDQNRSQYKRIQMQIEQLKKIEGDGAPVFVFGHFIIPHYPYVFDEDGEFVDPGLSAERTYAENYTKQLEYINKELSFLVTNIISNYKEKNKPEPIIILQADEGPHPHGLERPGKIKGFDWEVVSDRNLQIKFGILNAYYLPGQATSGWYSEITPVNNFRLIFHEYFGWDIDLLPDEHYIFKDRNHPYQFIEVSDRLEG